MENSELNRRDFHLLTMAAFGGALAGTAPGCSPAAAPPAAGPAAKSTPSNGTDAGQPADAGGDTAALENSVAAVGVEKHLCRGLNACKNQGRSGENECAGQGACATLEHHTCGGDNQCKGQGGCGKNAVENDCKGKGGCHVPLMDEVWGKARKIFEAKMKKAGKSVGAAPAEKS
jgi:hypothetical protein